MQTDLQQERRKLVRGIFTGFLSTVLIWLVFWADAGSSYRLNDWGILPRTLQGLPGILFSPLLHGDLSHIASNSIPLFILISLNHYFFRKIFWKMLPGVWLIGGFWTWCIGRPEYHIGASGLIYGLAAFGFMSGFLSKNRNLQALTLLVIFLYGGLIWGIFPIEINADISWEGHLTGLLAGVLMAYYFRKELPGRKKYEWEDEEDTEEDDDTDLKVNYIYKPTSDNNSGDNTFTGQ